MGACSELVGAPAQLARHWFAALLRDGFALAATGRSAAVDAVMANPGGGSLVFGASSGDESVVRGEPTGIVKDVKGERRRHLLVEVDDGLRRKSQRGGDRRGDQ